MKIKLCMLLLLTVIVSGCGTSPNAEAASSPAAASSVKPSASPKASAKPSAQPTAKPTAKKLTDAEQLAMDYITVYLNGSDLKAKKKFVDDKIHKDSQALFRLAQSKETPKENKLLTPKDVQSVKYKAGGKDVTAVLLKGKKNGADAEIIIVMADGKIGRGFMPSKNDKEQKAFDDMRKRFK